MSSIDPKTNPNKWLTASILDLVEKAVEGDKESKEVLGLAIRHICLGLEPGFIEDVFDQWIDSYIEKCKSNQNNC